METVLILMASAAMLIAPTLPAPGRAADCDEAAHHRHTGRPARPD